MAGHRERAAADLVEIHAVRSVGRDGLQVPVGTHVTVLVGPNRAGATSVLFALAASLDPALPFVPDRDLPFGATRLTTHPKVRWCLEHRRVTVWWDRNGRHHVDPTDGPAAAVTYAPVETTTAALLRQARVALERTPGRAGGTSGMADTIRAVAQRVIPEIAQVEIVDEASPRGGDPRVVLRDDGGAALPDAQARALVALGIAEHLGAAAGADLLVAIEAPEAFLHPAAQERLADAMTDIAARTSARVIIATTSPFVIPRRASTMVVALARDGQGLTRVDAVAAGDQPQAALLGGLLRDERFAGVLDRAGRVPDGTRAILIVEGTTDEAYLRHAAEVAGGAALEGVQIWPAGGAMGVALTAIVLRAEVATPVIALLDHDEAGRRARDTLVSRFGFSRSLHVLTYADVFDGVPQGVEAETLFDLEFMRAFVRAHPASVTSGERLEHGITTVTVTATGKAAFVDWMRERLDPERAGRWPALIDLIDARVAQLAAAGSTTSS